MSLGGFSLNSLIL